MANASCSKARQKASRNRCMNRRITGPRLLRRGMVCNWEVRSSSRSGNLWGLAAMLFRRTANKKRVVIPSESEGSGSCLHHQYSRRRQIPRSLATLGMTVCKFSPLLGCEFLGLAFVTHKLERALGFFVRLGDFFLHLGGRFFHFWREADVAVVFHAGAGRNQASHD